MGEIPLLTRQQEIQLAKKIEVTRRRFRTRLLECDYVIQAAYKVLKRVHEGELPFDRTVQVSVTDRLEKEQILGRLPHNLRTLEVLLKQTAATIASPSAAPRAGQNAGTPGSGWPVVAAVPCGWSRNWGFARNASSTCSVRWTSSAAALTSCGSK